MSVKAPVFLDVPQAAAVLGVHPALIYKEIRAGRLQAVKVGTRVIRISREALEVYAGRELNIAAIEKPAPPTDGRLPIVERHALSRRDYFAAAALQGFLAGYSPVAKGPHLIGLAVAMADELIMALEEAPQ